MGIGENPSFQHLLVFAHWCWNPFLSGSFNPFVNKRNLGSSKLKDFADDNFRFVENGKKAPLTGGKTLGEKEKVLVTSNFSFCHSVFKRLVLQTRKNQGLFGKGLKYGLLTL